MYDIQVNTENQQWHEIHYFFFMLGEYFMSNKMTLHFLRNNIKFIVPWNSKEIGISKNNKFKTWNTQFRLHKDWSDIFHILLHHTAWANVCFLFIIFSLHTVQDIPTSSNIRTTTNSTKCTIWKYHFFCVPFIFRVPLKF